MSTTTIYIRLLDEGTDVFRPALAASLGQGVFKVLLASRCDPRNEKWEFTPGSTVRCEKRKLAGDEVFVAVEAHYEAPPK